jgi:hypothetical protein
MITYLPTLLLLILTLLGIGIGQVRAIDIIQIIIITL